MLSLPFLSLGFALGLAHASDVDHVVAVSTMVGQRREDGGAWSSTIRAAARIGSLWGVGHMLTVFVVGGALIAFRSVVPEAVSMSGELCVAIMLVTIGLLSLRAASGNHRHAAQAAPHRGFGARSVTIGMVHGLAGSAAIALAVLTQTRNAATGLGYLFCFGVGTVAGMVALTSLLALPFALMMKSPRHVLLFRRIAGAASIAVGVGLFVKIGFVDGLLL